MNRLQRSKTIKEIMHDQGGHDGEFLMETERMNLESERYDDIGEGVESTRLRGSL